MSVKCKTRDVSPVLFSLEEITEGIRKGQFFTVAQPKFHLETNELLGFEFLARWEHPDEGVIYPGRFIPELELSGSLYLLTVEVFKRVILVSTLFDQSPATYTYSMNVSPIDLTTPGLVDTLISMASTHNIEPSQVTFEITETGAIFQKESQRALTRLKNYGFKLSIDDFWSGFSTLDSVRTGLFSEIKIDYALTSRVLDDATSFAGVRAIIQLARDLGLSCVVEGIESFLVKTVLQEEGAQVGQGYLFSEGIRDNEILDWVYSSTAVDGRTSISKDMSCDIPAFNDDEKILLESRPQPSWLWDFDEERIVWANPRGIEFWGFADLNSLLGNSYSDMSYAIKKRIQSYRMRFEEGEEEIRAEWVFYPRGTAKRAFCIQLPRIDKKTGRMLMMINAFEGIGTKLPTKKFIESVDKFPVPFFVVNDAGTLLSVNKHAHVDLNIKSDTVFDFMPRRDFEILRERSHFGKRYCRVTAFGRERFYLTATKTPDPFGESSSCISIAAFPLGLIEDKSIMNVDWFEQRSQQ